MMQISSQKKSVNGRQGRISRRKFFGAAASAKAAFTIVPRHVLGGAGHTAPSEMLNVAGVGVGGMGFVNLLTIAGLDMEWDGENMKVTNLDEANEYVRLQYRKGWSL